MLKDNVMFTFAFTSLIVEVLGLFLVLNAVAPTTNIFINREDYQNSYSIFYGALQNYQLYIGIIMVFAGATSLFFLDSKRQ